MENLKNINRKTLGAIVAGLIAVLAVAGLVVYFSTVGLKSQAATDQASLNAQLQSPSNQVDSDTESNADSDDKDTSDATQDSTDAADESTTLADLSSLLKASNSTNASHKNTSQSASNQNNQSSQSNQTSNNGENSNTGNQGSGSTVPDNGGNQGAQQPETPTTKTVSGTDGGTYTIPHDVHKFFTCNGVATEMVLMIGGSDACATLGQGFNTSRLFPAMQNVYSGLGSITTTTRTDATLENMAKYNADVLLSDVAATVAGMDGKSVMVSVGTPSALGTTGKLIAQALGTQNAVDKYNAWTSYYNEMQQSAFNTARSVAHPKNAVFARGVGTSNGASTITVGGTSSMADSWISLGGGVNVAHDIAGNFVQVNVEQFAQLAQQAGGLDYIFAENASAKASIEGNQTMQALMAEYGTQVVVVPNGLSVWSNAAAESPLMPIWAGYAMNIPEYKDSYNLKSLTQDFYKSFFNFIMSDSDYSLVTGF